MGKRKRKRRALTAEEIEAEEFLKGFFSPDEEAEKLGESADEEEYEEEDEEEESDNESELERQQEQEQEKLRIEKETYGVAAEQSVLTEEQLKKLLVAKKKEALMKIYGS